MSRSPRTRKLRNSSAMCGAGSLACDSVCAIDVICLSLIQQLRADRESSVVGWRGERPTLPKLQIAAESDTSGTSNAKPHRENKLQMSRTVPLSFLRRSAIHDIVVGGNWRQRERVPGAKGRS